MRKKSKKTNCCSEDSNLINLCESIPVANTYLEIDSQQLANLGISDRYFNRNYYNGINPLTDSTDLILRQNNFRTSLLSDKNHCSNLEGFVSVSNSYLGVGSPQIATIGASDKYFNRNVYSGVNAVANSTDLILGQSTIRTSVLSDNKYLLNLNESVSTASTYLGVGSPQIATIDVSDKYFNRNIYPGVNAVANSTDLILGQSTIRTSVLSDNKHLLNLNESVSTASTYLGVGSPQIAINDVSDKYFNRNIYPSVNAVANSIDLILGQSTIRTSVLYDNKHLLNLNESVSTASTYFGVGSPQLAITSASDKYFDKSVYSGVNHLPSTTDFISGKSTISPSLLSDKSQWTSLVGAVSVANTSLGIGSFELSNFNAVDKYSNRSVYSGVNHLASTTDFILGKSTISPTLLSDKNQWSSIAGANYFGSDNKFVESLNIGHLNKQLGKNGYLTNPISAIKEYDVFNIGNDFLKIENKDLERCIKQECQRIAEMVKIDPNHIGLEACGTSQKPIFNIYFVFTGSITSNNLQIGDKNITIVNYGK
ncbi:hypothetical protein [Lacihabitans soyangensis]|uniref:Uncharacterized protein n=1 Tax=Lacihabitans soyangensis TaxID=869394 RepID=A0AAE3KRJ1_9BACT|nr:hypothetical protein [Lacihabitans soyangensis]MCP9762173.1 hypothetical protein [Lacihabitans soyangensis]